MGDMERSLGMPGSLALSFPGVDLDRRLGYQQQELERDPYKETALRAALRIHASSAESPSGLCPPDALDVLFLHADRGDKRALNAQGRQPGDNK